MVMRLTDLEPEFVRRESDDRFRRVETLGEAHGILFVCPLCLFRSRRRPGVHSIICWDPSVPQTTGPTPGRWPMKGSGFHDLTLSPSILLTQPSCGWHGFITNGLVTGDGVENWEASMRVHEEENDQKSTGGSVTDVQPTPPAGEPVDTDAGGPFIVRKLTIGQMEKLVETGIAFEILADGSGAKIPVDLDPGSLNESALEQAEVTSPMHGTGVGDIIDRVREHLNVFENALALEQHDIAAEAHHHLLDNVNELRGHFRAS